MVAVHLDWSSFYPVGFCLIRVIRGWFSFEAGWLPHRRHAITPLRIIP
jgi:hypothetical protein